MSAATNSNMGGKHHDEAKHEARSQAVVGVGDQGHLRDVSTGGGGEGLTENGGAAKLNGRAPPAPSTIRREVGKLRRILHGNGYGSAAYEGAHAALIAIRWMQDVSRTEPSTLIPGPMAPPRAPRRRKGATP